MRAHHKGSHHRVKESLVRFAIDCRAASPDLFPDSMLAYVWIAIGGALGSVARFWFSGVVGQRFGETFPWGTLLVNITGSFAIGILAALAEPGGRRFIGPSGRQFFMYGICGGYTTFSSFSLQTLELIHDGDWLKAGANAVASLVLCLVAVWLGYSLGASLNGLRGS